MPPDFSVVLLRVLICYSIHRNLPWPGVQETRSHTRQGKCPRVTPLEAGPQVSRLGPNSSFSPSSSPFQITSKGQERDDGNIKGQEEVSEKGNPEPFRLRKERKEGGPAKLLQPAPPPPRPPQGFPRAGRPAPRAPRLGPGPRSRPETAPPWGQARGWTRGRRMPPVGPVPASLCLALRAGVGRTPQAAPAQRVRPGQAPARPLSMLLSRAASLPAPGPAPRTRPRSLPAGRPRAAGPHTAPTSRRGSGRGAGPRASSERERGRLRPL